MTLYCPSCGRALNPNFAFNAISRKDNQTMICSDCGFKEALIDYFALHKEGSA